MCTIVNIPKIILQYFELISSEVVKTLFKDYSAAPTN